MKKMTMGLCLLISKPRRNLQPLIIILSLIHCALLSPAQNTPLDQISIASPAAASLGKYADIPVHYHTGIPQISIPLYTIKEGPLTVPVSLSYHSSGLKVLEVASSVGTGWALNAGGAITRTVIGAPDDRGLLAALTKYGHFHDYGYNNYLFLPSETGCGGTAPPCPTGTMHPANDQGIANQIRDGEPDLYFFNFNGYTGKFYFIDDRTPVLVPQQDLKIEPILAPETGIVPLIYMQGFIITTPDGTKYFFGKNQVSDGNIDAIETTTSINTHSTNITNQGAVSSWFLNRIVTADDQFSVRFIYQPERFSHYTVSTHPIWNVENDATFNSPYGNHEYDLAKNFINGVRLQQIVFSTGTVNFNTGIIRNDLGDFDSKVLADVANTQAASLGSITITGNNGFCKKINLHQTYFQDNNSPVNGFYANNFSISSDRYRLRLDGITELSCDASIQLPSYVFEYFSEGGSSNFAPRLLTFGQDHWGFYNGVLFNQGLLPTYFLNNIPVEGADRDPHWPAMRTGALKKIIYPTGGITEFDYEPNDTYGTIFGFTKVQALSISCGYDGSTTNATTYTFSGNMYEINLSNANAGSVSNLVITDGNNNTVFSLSTNPGESKTEYVTLSAGTYTVRITKNTTFTGNGTSAQFHQWVANNTTGNLMVGGLRIKTITRNDDLTGNNIVTNYAYKQGAGTQSSGILYSRPTYVSLLRNNIVQLIGGGQTPAACSFHGCVNCDGSTNHKYYKSGGTIFPMTTTQGNHIGYDEVKVSQTGNGHSIFRYYGSAIWGNINNDIVNRRLNNSSCDVNIPNFPPAPLPFEFKRGDLKYEGHFTEEGKAVKEAYYYPEYTMDIVKTPGYKVAFLGGTGNPLWGTEYELQSARKSKLEVITFESDESTGAYVTNSTRDYYGSAWHNEVTRHVTFTSSGDSIIKINKYAQDFRISDCDNISDGWSAWLTAYNNAASTFSSSLNCTSGSWNCRWLAFQQFRFDKSVARQNYINHRRMNFTDPGNTFNACRANAKNAADAQLKPILELQEEFKNAAIESSEWINNELTGATFTHFDFAVSPPQQKYTLPKYGMLTCLPHPGSLKMLVPAPTINR
jgi:hypothetical protein